MEVDPPATVSTPARNAAITVPDDDDDDDVMVGGAVSSKGKSKTAATTSTSGGGARSRATSAAASTSILSSPALASAIAPPPPARNGSSSSSSSGAFNNGTSSKSAAAVAAAAQVDADLPGGPITPAEIQWMWSAKEFDDWTPSRAAGIDVETERLQRYLAVKFIFQLAERLNLWGHVIHSASVYLHRFFLRKPMKSKLPEHNLGYDHLEVAAACVFLASKNEEQHRKLGQIIEVAIALMNANSNGRNPLGVNSPENFRRWRDTIIAYEDELFPTLCADLDIGQPVSIYIEAAQIFELGREQIYSGIQMLHDMDRDVYCQLHEANLQAAAVFYIIHMMAGLDVYQYEIPDELLDGYTAKPDDEQGRFWRIVFFCEPYEVRECTAAIVAMYKWRRATVDKSMRELEADMERRVRYQLQALQQSQRHAVGELVSPRRPGSSVRGDTPGPGQSGGDTSDSKHGNASTQLQRQSATSTASPLNRPNGHRQQHQGHHHQHQQHSHLHSSVQDASSSSTAYTPELRSADVDGGSSFGAQQQELHESDRRARAQRDDGSRSASRREGDRAGAGAGVATGNRPGLDVDDAGSSSAASAALGPRQPADGPAAVYTLASPMLEDTENENEGAGVGAAQQRQQEEEEAAAAAARTQAEAQAQAPRWRPLGQQERPQQQHHQFNVPLSPEMPGDDDDEEGAVEGGV